MAHRIINPFCCWWCWVPTPQMHTKYNHQSSRSETANSRYLLNNYPPPPIYVTTRDANSAVICSIARDESWPSPTSFPNSASLLLSLTTLYHDSVFIISESLGRVKLTLVLLPKQLSAWRKRWLLLILCHERACITVYFHCWTTITSRQHASE